MENNTAGTRPIDRLREYLATKELSDSRAEKLAQLANGYISKLSKGTGNMGTDILNKLLSAFPDLSLKWLVTGVKESGVSAPDDELMALQHQIDTVIKMPVMDMQFAAGASAYAPEYLETTEMVFIPRAWLRRGSTFACGRLRGDSMAPTLLDSGYGIIRLLDRSEWYNMPNEEIYVVVTKDGGQLANVQVKRVKNRFDQGFVVMTSDNPDKASHPNFNIYIDEIVSIWHMDWYFTSRMPNIHNQYYSRLQALEDKFDDLVNELRPIKRL